MNRLILCTCLSSVLLGACSRDAAPAGHRPCDPQADAATAALYENLFRIPSKGIMFGHQDDLLYGHGWKYEPDRSDVKECCGDYPAVAGWELGGLEAGCERSIDDVPFDTIARLLCAAYERGAVNTLSWHPQNPETGGTAWDCQTTTAVRSILPGGEHHAQFRLWLDRLAAFFASLKGEDGSPVPVLFRPFHENTGSGFWWGEKQCTPDEYKALWRFTISYLRDEKGLHNLLYIYSPDLFRDAGHYLERYPGDEWVDILGLDAYHRQQDWDFLSGGQRMLATLQSLGEQHHKPTAFTETGLEGIPDPHWWTQWLLPVIRGKGLCYVLVWRNAHDRADHFFGPWVGHASEEDFRAFVANDQQPVLLESQLPDMYHIEK